MKLSCLRQNLIKALNLVSRIIGTKITLPILSNILFSTDKGRLKLSSTDLELGINAWIGAKVEKEGSITVPARLFNEFINSINEEKINLDADDKQIVISDEKNKSVIRGLTATDFPLIPEIKNPIISFKINSKKIKNAIEKTAFACAIDETKPVLSGILFQIKNDQIILASTDSYRLAEYIIKTKDKNEKEISFIIPKRTANELARIIGEVNEEVKIKVSENQISFEYNNTYFISRLIEGNFPDYSQIIPAKFNTIIEIEKEQLHRCLKTSSLFSRESANNVKITISDKKLEIESKSQQLGENYSQIPILKNTGSKIDFSINSNFLLESLSVIEDSIIEIKIVDKNSPILLKSPKNPNCLYLIMPLKQE